MPCLSASHEHLPPFGVCLTYNPVLEGTMRLAAHHTII